ncbi:MAG: MerR family transcriptional regulator [Pseudomonadota bacterium]
MKIGELAKLTGVATSRIRFYEKHGLMPRPSRQDNGYRDYPESMISRLHTITMSKALGFSLSEIRRFLPDDPRENMKRQEIISNLEAKLADVDSQIKRLQKIKNNVKEIITNMKANGASSC